MTILKYCTDAKFQNENKIDSVVDLRAGVVHHQNMILRYHVVKTEL